MRLFQNCMEAIREIERDLFEMGIVVHPETMQDKDVADDDNYKTTEVSPYVYTIMNGYDKDEMLKYMKLPVDYAEAEIKDRLNFNEWPLNPGNSWLLRPEVWEQFLHDEGFSYTYNERLFNDDRTGKCQLTETIELLKKHPNSRQAIVQIYDYFQDNPNRAGSARVPCSVTYQFMIRKGVMDLHYYQRSGDFLTHLPYDIWLALAMLEHVAKEVGVPAGNLHHYIASLHAYYGHMKERGIF